MFNKDNFTLVVERSGLSKSEIATIYGVTRQTVYNWLAGAGPTTHLLADLEPRYTAALAAAIKRGVLPLAKGLSQQERQQRLTTMRVRLHEIARPK